MNNDQRILTILRFERTQMADATLTAKGQTTIPKEIREQLGLEAGDKLTFTTLSDGTVVMRAKTRRLLDLAGTLSRPGQPTITVAEMKSLRD
jgi:antitoxin PrlF